MRRVLSGVLVLCVVGLLAAGAGGVTVASNRAAAQADAARLLKRVPLPPGAVRSVTEPAGDGGVLGRAGEQPASQNLVDDVAWWVIPASAGSVTDYVNAHRPRGTTIVSTGTSGGPGVPSATTEALQWRPVGGVLGWREVVLESLTLADGSTGLRIDGQSVWLTPRSAAERIPAGAQRITVTVLGVRRKVLQGPLAVVAPARITRVAALIDALAVVQPDLKHCPPDSGTRIRLGFYARRGAPPLAVATIAPGGCTIVGLTIAGHNQPALQGSTSLIGALQRAVGVSLQSAFAAP